MTLEEFLKHADDAIYMGNLDLLRPHAAQVFKERDEALAEAAAWRATAADKGYSSREVAKERDEARAEVEKLRAALRASPSRW